MKFPLPQLLLASFALPALLSGCKPGAANPHQINALHEQNAHLREQIANMEALIRQAGDDVPGLAEQIAQREEAVKAATEELCLLTQQETELKLRALHLQARLDAFQHSFQQMQKDLTNASRR